MIAVHNDNDLLMVSSVKPHISPGILFMLLTVVHKLSTGENISALEMRIAHIRTGID